MNSFSDERRDFLRRSVYLGAAVITNGPLSRILSAGPAIPSAETKFGLVTYLWGRDWDLPTLISNCEKTGILGVELRAEHAHGVESNLTKQQRDEVKNRFADNPVTLVGLGTNFAFHYTDPARLHSDIEGAKEYVKLSYDVGGSGIKVKPNDLPPGVTREKTIEQIGKSLNELGKYAADFNQQIRLEVHGGCSQLPVIKSIMDVADHPNVAVCWNCNDEDLKGLGLEYNFDLVKNRFGDTVHVRELNVGDYPYQELMNLLVKMNYQGWVLLEARTDPPDRVKALLEQRQIWERMVANAKSSLSSDSPTGRGVQITELPDKVKVEVNGKLFTEYNFKNVRFPYFYPVVGPSGFNITRRWPMEEGENEQKDHPHHRSLWFTHGAVNGCDFWTDGDRNGKIIHDKFLEISSGPDSGIIKSQNKYVTADGTLVCTDTRTHRFYSAGEGQIMDFEVTIHASEGEVVLGDTKEGSMALRLAPTLRLRGSVGQGHIVNSEGVRDNDTWGKRAAWCDYYGPLNGETVGVAIFDNPKNPKHPTWWHVRDYGLFAANPFGVSDFENKPKGTGNITIPQGESLTFKYRIYIHKGDQEQGKVAERYKEYAEKYS